MRYVVYSLDMWGHVPADCVDHGCPCMVECPDCDDGIQDCDQCSSHKCDTCGGKEHIHDDDRCDCHEDCNQQFRAGEIEVSEDATDDAILDALTAEGFLTELGRKVAVIVDYYSDDGPLDVNDNEGRRLFYLEPDAL